jgi:hypothetical protein
VEGHRYADESEPSWYSGKQYAPAGDPEVSGSHAVADPHDSGVHERPSGAFRLPEQRPYEPEQRPYEPEQRPYEPEQRPYGAEQRPYEPEQRPYVPEQRPYEPEQRPYVPEQRPYQPDPLTSTSTGTGTGTGTSGHQLPPEPETRAAYDSVRLPIRGPEYPAVRPTSTPTSTPAPAPVAAPTPIPEPPAPLTAPPIPAHPFTASPVPESLVPVAEPTSLVPPITADRARLEQQPRPAENVYRTRRPVSSFLVAFVMLVLLIPVVRLLLNATFAGEPSARSIVPAVLLALGFTLTGIGLFAVAGSGPINRESWLRPPVAYLPAGLVLLVAAGLAAA